MLEEIKKFKSSGKFLITAEYLILKGAMGLALPLNRGQQLEITPNQSQTLHWISKEFNNIWFNASYDIDGFDILSTNDPSVAKALQNVLIECRALNPDFLLQGVEAQIVADFDLSWGLGSSSTLIHSMANWAEVNPYSLLESTFGGSGYDIACASAKGPVTYQLNSSGRTVTEVPFNPPFKENIFFVYLGKKMNSRTGMRYFNENAIYGELEINTINSITDQLIKCDHLKEFEKLLSQHEHIMSTVLKMPTIKDSLFRDYPFTIKSMGAWSGDFILVTGKNMSEVKTYFNNKGLTTIIGYTDIVLS